VLEGTTILWIHCLLEFNLKHIYNSKETVRNSKFASQKLVKNDSSRKVNISRTANTSTGIYYYMFISHISGQDTRNVTNDCTVLLNTRILNSIIVLLPSRLQLAPKEPGCSLHPRASTLAAYNFIWSQLCVYVFFISQLTMHSSAHTPNRTETPSRSNTPHSKH